MLREERAPTLQQGKITLCQASESLIAWGKQGEIPLLFQQVSQVSGFHQGQKDPATNKCWVRET